MKRLSAVCLLALAPFAKTTIKRIPAIGIEAPPDDRAALEAGLVHFNEDWTLQDR